jgi:hypothetical protein
MDKMPPLDGAFDIGGQALRFDQILDGLSNTLLVGEKHVPWGTFGQGWLDNSTYNGDYPQCFCRAGGPENPLAQSTTEMTWSFGSYHMGVVLFNFADGSVRPLPVSIDPNVLGLLAGRNDGQTIPAID